MKPKYINHYKNTLKIRRIWWKFLLGKFFRKNTNHLRRKLLRKYFRVLVFDYSKAITLHIDKKWKEGKK